MLDASAIYIAANRKLKSDNYVSTRSSFHMCRPHKSRTLWFCRRHRCRCLIQPRQRLANLIKNYSFCVSFCVRSNCMVCALSMVSSLSIRNYIFEWHFVCRTSDGCWWWTFLCNLYATRVESRRLKQSHTHTLEEPMHSHTRRTSSATNWSTRRMKGTKMEQKERY